MPRIFLQGLLEYLPKLKPELANQLLVFIEKAMLPQQVEVNAFDSHDMDRNWIEDSQGHYEKYLKKGNYRKITIESFGEYIRWTQTCPHEYFEIFKKVTTDTAPKEENDSNKVVENEIEDASTSSSLEPSPSTSEGDQRMRTSHLDLSSVQNFTWTGTVPEMKFKRCHGKKSLYERVFEDDSEDEIEGVSNSTASEPRPSEGDPHTSTLIDLQPGTEPSEDEYRTGEVQNIEMPWWYELDKPVMENKLWKEKEKKNVDNLRSKNLKSNTLFDRVCGSLDRLDCVEAESSTTDAEPTTSTSEIEAGTPTSDINP